VNALFSGVADRAKDSAWIVERRRRLCDLGWLMKLLKEPISRRANKEDHCTGTFFEGRFKSVAILDEASLLATCASIDLNPVAAGIAATPGKSSHTSAKARVDHCKAQGKLKVMVNDSPLCVRFSAGTRSLAVPVEDQRNPNGIGLAGMLHGVSLTGYLQLLDWTSRLIRLGKVNLAASVPPLLARLNIEPSVWRATLEKLLRTTKKVGSYFGSSERLGELATQRGCRFLKNITGRDSELTTSKAS
jgi:hypothetical protein